jgi:hypothetical protein
MMTGKVIRLYVWGNASLPSVTINIEEEGLHIEKMLQEIN